MEKLEDRHVLQLIEISATGLLTTGAANVGEYHVSSWKIETEHIPRCAVQL
jgi:hypothetical protein